MHPARLPLDDGLWSPHRRALTVGLVLTITLVAFEALAVSTVMPIVAKELGGIAAVRLGLHGVLPRLARSASSSSAALIDRGGLAGRSPSGSACSRSACSSAASRRPMQVLVAARFVQGLGAGHDPTDRLRRHRPERCPNRSGRGCSRRSRPPGSCPGSSARPSPDSSGSSSAGACVFLGLLPLIATAGLLTIRALAAVPLTGIEEAAEARPRRRSAAGFRTRCSWRPGPG